MPSSSMRKKAIISTMTNNNLTRPSLIDTMLLTSTPLRHSPGIQSTMASTRSATNIALRQAFKEKNQAYEDIQLLNLTKSMNKAEKQKNKKSTSTLRNLNKRSRNRTTNGDRENLDETDNDEDLQPRKKSTMSKRKTTVSKVDQSEESTSKQFRQSSGLDTKRMIKTPIGKTSAGSSDGCTTVDEEIEETHLIEQSKLYIEGPGIRQNHKKIGEHNSRIGEQLHSLRTHQQMSHSLPSPILTRSTNGKQDVTVGTTQTSSPVKVKTASRITFALPPQSTSPIPRTLFDPVPPPSPQMPPTAIVATAETQTDNTSDHCILRHEKQCQTKAIDSMNQSMQTESVSIESTSIGVQCQSDLISGHHVVCRDLTVCTCVEQLVKTRQFLADTCSRFQSPTVSRSAKSSKQTTTIEDSTPSNMVLAKSSLKAEQQIIFEQFISFFNIRTSNTVDETTSHLITDSLDDNSPLVCPLTLKVIQATARHLPIISIQWLVASLTHRIIVPSQVYEIFLGDPTYGYHGGFLRSRIPRSQNLFQGIGFRLECVEEHGCQSILADNRALRELICLGGGTIIDESNPNYISTIIILCNQIKRRDHIYTAYVKPEWLLASIAQYNLQPFQHFSVHFSE